MRKNFYLVLDTETATLPFVPEYGEDARKNLAIAKPLVYDIGWQVVDTQGNVYKRQNYLVQETFFVPNVFNTAYYCEKRPIYMAMYERGEITAKNWNDIIPELIADAKGCKAVCAYNAAFDFKKAIPFTERYIEALYGDYNRFEHGQRFSCEKIANGAPTGRNPKYITPVWEVRNNEFPIIDLWDVACSRLINIPKYKKYCLSTEQITESAQYFKTSAESTFRYLSKQYDFIEAHTALDDATIESVILAKALKKGKIDPCMGCFPFRDLGTTFDFIKEHAEYTAVVADVLRKYIESKDGFFKADDGIPYWRTMVNRLERMESALDEI